MRQFFLGNPALTSDQEVKVSASIDAINPQRGIIVVGNLAEEHKIIDLRCFILIGKKRLNYRILPIIARLTAKTARRRSNFTAEFPLADLGNLDEMLQE